MLGLPEADFGWLHGHVLSSQDRVEVCLCFRRRVVPDRLEAAAVVEPVDQFDGGIFHGFEVAQRPITSTGGRAPPSPILPPPCAGSR
jgi:hypothetical protein